MIIVQNSFLHPAQAPKAVSNLQATRNILQHIHNLIIIFDMSL